MKFIPPAHPSIIQAACGSLGTSLGIKFPLNSLRIEQLCFSDYHRLPIMKGGVGRGTRKGMEIRDKALADPGDRRTQGPRDTGIQSTGQGHEPRNTGDY